MFIDRNTGAEVRDPVRRVPKSMIMTVVINSIFAWAFIVCLLYTLGDLSAVSSSTTGYPIIEVYYEATKSKAGTNIMMVMLLIVIAISCFSIFASVSRLVWAFARDNGLPFSEFFAYVSLITLFLGQWYPTLNYLIPLPSTVSSLPTTPQSRATCKPYL